MLRRLLFAVRSASAAAATIVAATTTAAVSATATAISATAAATAEYENKDQWMQCLKSIDKSVDHLVEVLKKLSDQTE